MHALWYVPERPLEMVMHTMPSAEEREVSNALRNSAGEGWLVNGIESVEATFS